MKACTLLAFALLLQIWSLPALAGDLPAGLGQQALHSPAALRQQFQELIYGVLPPQQQLQLRQQQAGILSQSAIGYQQVTLEIRSPSDKLRSLHLLHLSPSAPQPRSARSSLRLLFLNKCGNQALLPDPEIQISEWVQQGDPVCKGKRGQRGGEASGWKLKQALKEGFEIWTLHESDMAPDDPQVFEQVLAQLSAKIPFAPQAKPGILALWAWGLRHVLDYLEPTPDSPICLMGHSRRGKTALLTAALDPRVACVIAHQSGTLGAVSVQNHPAESLESILSFFPHWFTPGLQSWRQRAEALPLNQAQLISLIAPRPVVISEGLFDLWASPGFSLQSLQQAAPAWGLKPGQIHSYLSWSEQPEQPEQPERLKSPLLHRS